jgi:hypothetical protein
LLSFERKIMVVASMPHFRFLVGRVKCQPAVI